MRKCTRTFASAVRLMDDYPDYRFACSQAVQYEWMRDRHPALFARIQEKAAAGQWIPVGGMWVEADMNLPSGESIVRQLVHGQRFFEQHFGRRCREVWIPDVFGYPASLPQIFAAAGCDRFVTQKLSWNKENRFPHSTFWWEGIDGTRVLTHFPPVETYNAMVDPAEQIGIERNFHDHGWSDWSLTPFGYGDGGGGPTREMVERARRMADLDGVPRLELGTVDEFFAHVEAEAAGGAPVPVWRGELYFEMHRGTLTSQVGDEGRQPPLRALLLRGRAVVDDALGWPGDGGGRAGRAVEGRCWCSSSTTSSPARRSPGSTPTPRPSTLGSPTGWSSWSRRRSGGWRPPRWPWPRPAVAPGARWWWRRYAPVGGGPSQLLAGGSTAFVAEVPGLRRLHGSGARDG